MSVYRIVNAALYSALRTHVVRTIVEDNSKVTYRHKHKLMEYLWVRKASTREKPALDTQSKRNIEIT